MEIATNAEVGRGYLRRVNLVLEDARERLETDPQLAKERPDLESTINKAREFRCAECNCFADVLGALKDYVRREVAQAKSEYVETSLGKLVFDAADYVFETGRWALVEGASSFGKTTALKAWCAMYPWPRPISSRSLR